jgi:steroid delta-isomerase-like uncharacterized protein
MSELAIARTMSGRESLENWGVLWSSQDLGLLLTIFTEDCVYHDLPFGSVNRGKQEIEAFAKNMFAAFRNFKIENRSVVYGNNQGVVEWTFSGIHDKDLPDLPATHKPFSIPGVSVIEMKSGIITRCTDYWDLFAFQKQVGLFQPA